MVALDLAVAGNDCVIRPVQGTSPHELCCALETLMASNSRSVARSLSLRHINFIGRVRAESLAQEFMVAGVPDCAAMLRRLIASPMDDVSYIVIQPSAQLAND